LGKKENATEEDQVCSLDEIVSDGLRPSHSVLESGDEVREVLLRRLDRLREVFRERNGGGAVDALIPSSLSFESDVSFSLRIVLASPRSKRAGLSSSVRELDTDLGT